MVVMGEPIGRERRLRTSLAATQACAEFAREMAEHWAVEAERAASLAASIRALLAERVPAGRAGGVEGVQTLSVALGAAGIPLASDRDRDPLDAYRQAERERRMEVL